MSIRVSEISFTAGAGTHSTALRVCPEHLLIFVGPNNSGKTKALKEINEIANGNDDAPRVVIQNIRFDLPKTAAEIMDLMRKFETRSAPGGFMMSRRLTGFSGSSGISEHRIEETAIQQWISESNQHSLRVSLVGPFLLPLNGVGRVGSVETAQMGDLKSLPPNHVAFLFKNDTARERLRAMFRDTFGGYLVIDPTVGGGLLSFKVSARPPSTISEERGLDNKALAFHSTATPLSEFGDGVRAFTGILVPIMGSDSKIILIDEPEAFLHPPQARRLGNYLAELSNERKGSTLIATHSSDFVMGCLEKGAHHTTVVRLTYSSGVATARMLPSSDLVPMFRDPLLRSTGVLNALFHKCAVVTEADADRAFYSEINRRLNEDNRGIQDAVFLNAIGKPTLHRLIRPLRKLGIPAAAIADLDFLRVPNKSEWPNLLDACGVPMHQIIKLDKDRESLLSYFTALPPSTDGRSALKSSGLDALDSAVRRNAENLLAELAKYGLFLVPKGELENWLNPLGIAGKKVDWLVNAFERLGNGANSKSYVTAGNDDVWVFLDVISKWTEDPNRLGMH